MNEIIQCPSCQRKLTLPETLMGQDVQCPTCGATFTAKASGGSAWSSPSASPEPPQREAPRYDEDDRERRRPRYDEDDRERRRPRYDEYDDDYGDDYGARRTRRRDVVPHRGGTILTMGILSLVICGLIFGPIAWVMGNTDLTEIRAGRMDPEGEGLTRAGQICGMIGTILTIVVLCIYLAIFVLAVGAGGRRF